MDQRLEKALAIARLSAGVREQRAAARLKYENDVRFSYGGGIFNAGTELISFLGTLDTLGKTQVVLHDLNGFPVLVEDLKGFLSDVVERYYQATHEHLATDTRIKRSRSIEAAIK